MTEVEQLRAQVAQTQKFLAVLARVILEAGIRVNPYIDGAVKTLAQPVDKYGRPVAGDNFQARRVGDDNG